jgi:hypothetical protein
VQNNCPINRRFGNREPKFCKITHQVHSLFFFDSAQKGQKIVFCRPAAQIRSETLTKPYLTEPDQIEEAKKERVLRTIYEEYRLDY